MAVPVARLAALQMAEGDKTWAIALAGAGVLGVAGLVSIYFLTKRAPVPPGEAEEGEWAAAHWVLAKAPFSIEIRQPEVGDWRPAYTVLASMPFSVEIGEPEVGDWRPAYTVLASMPFSVEIGEPEVGDWGPDYAPLASMPFQVTISGVGASAPVVATLPATNITSYGATLGVQLVRECSEGITVCYIEWGETTNYELGRTADYQLFSGQVEDEAVSLTPNTTYHFRAVAQGIIVGQPILPELRSVGQDLTFTTEAVTFQGFWMRVTNPPAGALYWRAWCFAVQDPAMPQVQSLYHVWTWTGEVPTHQVQLYVDAYGPEQPGPWWPTIQSDSFPFLLRDGKSYVWDFAARQMREL